MNRAVNLKLAVSTVFVLLACSGISIASQVYWVTDIGSGYIFAQGVNEKNQVVGYVTPNGSWSEAYAFLWTTDTGLTSIGGCCGYAINNLGQIAGKSELLQAAVWENGSWIILEGRQEAWAINDSGQVTGLISAQLNIHAPYRDDDIHTPGFVELVRPFGDTASHGYDINNKGQVVADCRTPPPRTRLYVAILHEPDGTYTILDDGGNYETYPHAINDLGQIVGDTKATLEADHYAIFWDTPDSEIEYIGSLGDGSSTAYAINNLGQAVGTSAGKAFLWSKADGMLDLNNLVDPNLGITLTKATDISNNGSITSYGFDSIGQRHSYLLTLNKLSIPACVNINPNTLNFQSKGKWVTCYIRLPEGYGVTDIDPNSILLEDEIEPDILHLDADTQIAIIKFSRSELADLLVELDLLGEVELIVTGQLTDGTIFEGLDSIRVIDKGGKNK